MKNDPKSKKGKILKHLQAGKTITPYIALSQFSHFRLASCICRLRDEGFNITTTMKTNTFKEPFAEYNLEEA